MTMVLVTLVVFVVTETVWADSIRLHSEVSVQSQVVTLRQIAELTGKEAEIAGDAVVGRFIGNNDELVIHMAGLRDALDDAKVNWALLTLHGYERCLVHRVKPDPEDHATADADASASNAERAVADTEPGVSADPQATLRSRVEAALGKLAGVSADQLRITFRDQDAKWLSQSVGVRRFEIAPAVGSSIGRVPVTVRRYDAGRVAEMFTVTADVQRQVKAVVVTRHLSRGDRFTEDAIELRDVWIDDDREPVADLAAVRDQQVDATMRSGALVYADDVCSPVLIDRGELVTVRCLSGSLVVRTTARALEEGAIDQVIRLRNAASKEEFHATVTGRRQAVMRLDGDSAAQDAKTSSAGESAAQRPKLAQHTTATPTAQGGQR